MSIIKLVFTFMLSLFQLLSPYFGIAFSGGLDAQFEKWSPESAYTADYAVTLEKEPDKNFVILNFTDIQLSDDTLFGKRGEYTEALVDTLIKKVKPDLITLTGDNSSCDVGYLRWIEILDSYGIPWAPVMGNHDGDNGKRLKEGWDSYNLANAKNCLFRFGPADMGYGNYIINITENGNIIHTLFMLDTHSSADDTDAGKINCGPDGKAGYDHLWANQIEWYKWAVNGIASLAGKTVESTAFMHIPVIEYKAAEKLYTEDGELKEEYSSCGYFGSLGEDICCPEGNNGFFETAKELGSTTMMIAGHDHTNTLCVQYEGIWLNYAQKSGHGSYWDDEKMGGSVVEIDSDGHSAMYHVDYSADYDRDAEC